MRLVLLPAVILRRPDPVSALGCRTRPKWARFHCEEACQVRSPTLHPWSYLPTNRNYAAVCVITHRVLSLENGFDGALVQPQEFQKDPRHTDGNTGVPLYSILRYFFHKSLLNKELVDRATLATVKVHFGHSSR